MSVPNITNQQNKISNIFKINIIKNLKILLKSTEYLVNDISKT